MDDENNIFEADRDEGELPFNYIIDKVLERIDTVEDIANDSYGEVLKKQLGLKADDEHLNNMDPDYCEDVNFDEITPEDFQLYISVPNVDGDADENDVHFTTDDGTNVNSDYDSIFNA